MIFIKDIKIWSVVHSKIMGRTQSFNYIKYKIKYKRSHSFVRINYENCGIRTYSFNASLNNRSRNCSYIFCGKDLKRYQNWMIKNILE
jgi:hypothetical protein